VKSCLRQAGSCFSAPACLARALASAGRLVAIFIFRHQPARQSWSLSVAGGNTKACPNGQAGSKVHKINIIKIKPHSSLKIILFL